MDAALGRWIAATAPELGARLSGIISSTWFRCFLVFALGGLCGRVFDHFAHRGDCDARRKPLASKPVTLRKLKTSEILETEECTVCLELLAPKYCCEELHNLQCVRLVCGHAFHEDCIGKWLQRDSRQSCPVCRMDAATQEQGLRRRSFWQSAK